MRDDYNYSSASMSEYIHWVMKDKLHMTDREVRDFLRTMEVLASVEFVCNHPMDDNRAIDGLELRDDFEYETGRFLDKSSGLLPRCTFFEMLAALAMRCESQLMRNLSIGDRTSRWFFEFLYNLGISDPGMDERYICRLTDPTNYSKMFPLKNRSRNAAQRNEQIWNQAMAYLNENYMNEDPDLVLFN